MNKQKILAMMFFCFLLVGVSLLSAVSLVNINNYPSQVSQGETVKISMGIKNTLSQDVSNVNIKLNLETVPFAPYESSSERFIDSIREGKIEYAEFNLIALPSASSGIYKIPVEINYEKDDGSLATKSELVSVTINSDAEIKVSIEDGLLIRGRENTLNIKIVNSGLSDIKFTYLIINTMQGIQFLSNGEQYLGDINSNDFDNSEFKVYVSEDAPDLMFLQTTIKYKDATNQEFTEVKQIAVKSFSVKQAQELGLIAKPSYGIYFIIIILLGIYFIRRFLKKRKKNRR